MYLNNHGWTDGELVIQLLNLWTNFVMENNDRENVCMLLKKKSPRLHAPFQLLAYGDDVLPARTTVSVPPSRPLIAAPSENA